MILDTEVLKRAPIWVMKFIFLDMEEFAHRIRIHIDYKEEALQADMGFLRQSSDHNFQQVVQQLNHISRCLLNYAYVNNISIKDMNEERDDYLHAKITWDIINASQKEDMNPNFSTIESYSDRSYMYCILIWNCAQQILLDKVDVYNDTIGDFFEWIVEYLDTKYIDERTQPLFKLISQLGYFHT